MSEFTGSGAPGANGPEARQRAVPEPDGPLPNLDELAERAKEWEGALRHFARAHPIPVLVGAAAAGYLLARLVRGLGEDR